MKKVTIKKNVNIIRHIKYVLKFTITTPDYYVLYHIFKKIANLVLKSANSI